MKRKFTFSNNIDPANNNFISPNLSAKGKTTNSGITDKMFKKECELFDKGELPAEHDSYLGERYV